MQLAKINGSGTGWRRKIKMATIYYLLLGKLMLVALHFVSIAINLRFTVIQARKIYSSMLRNQQNACLVRKSIYPPHSYTSLEEAYNRFIK